MTIDSIKNNIDSYSIDDISHFWKLAKVYMEKVKNNSNDLDRLRVFQSFLEKRMKKLKKLHKSQL